jgi:probable H4MPT-linked C1 transfer pathway protein
MRFMNCVALDIGGANIKAADGRGYAASYPFPLWREAAGLAQQLHTAISDAPHCEKLAITMTGELADCFTSKADGVRHILQAVTDAADNRPTRVYLTDGRLVSPDEALTAPLLAAASNWHGLATFCGRFTPQGSALLIDIGSTTTDIIPLMNGRPVAQGTTDTTRLLAGELVYTGVERSLACAIVQAVPYRGEQCGVAQEYFATSLDAYLVLDQIAERPADCNTPDGKPATKAAACTRLGRLLAADGEEFNEDDAVQVAEAIVAAQRKSILVAIQKVLARLPSPPGTYILSGHGEFLAMSLLEHLPPVERVVRLAAELGDSVSRCAPAHALAVLACEASSS